MANANSTLTQARLKEVLRYDPETGIFTWIRPCARNLRPGDEAGSDNGKGHMVIMVFGRGYQAHQLAWLYMTGGWADQEIDHKDTYGLNNKWTNLRAATHAQNMLNRKMNSNNTSGYKGVTWSKRHNKWIAQIQLNRKNHIIGRFDDKELAAKAISEARERLHGEFANHGLISTSAEMTNSKSSGAILLQGALSGGTNPLSSSPAAHNSEQNQASGARQSRPRAKAAIDVSS